MRPPAGPGPDPRPDPRPDPAPGSDPSSDSSPDPVPGTERIPPGVARRRAREAAAAAHGPGIGTWLRRLLGALVFVTAIALPLLHEPDREVQTLVARWAPPPSDFLDLQGQLVHVRDEGPPDDPVPVLLLHGTSASLHTWDGWAQALKARHRVLRLDLPAFGLTGPFTGAYAGRPYTGEQLARFVLDVLDRLQVQRVHVAGNSLGGEVAWRLAAFAPDRVKSVVLVDPAGYPLSDGSIPLGWQVARAPVLGRITEHVLTRGLVAQGLHAVYGDPAKVTPALVERYFELTLRAGNRAALVQRAQSWSRSEGVQRIEGVRAPTLLLWGGLDRVIPPAHAQQFLRDIPGARLVRFDDLGHVPHEEDPARTVAPVLQFLAAQR